MKEKILLLHGALGTSAQMQLISKNLENHFEVMTMDFTCHGKMANEHGTFTMRQLADDIITFLKKKEVTSTHLFGYSMGGYAGLAAALAQPEMFRSITTLGTMFHWNEEHAQKEIRFLNPDVILQKVPAFAAKLHELHGEHWRALLHQTADMMLSLGRDPLFEAKDLKTLPMPLAFITGELDQTADPLFTEKFSDGSGAQFHLLKQTPHPIKKADSQIVSEIIQRNAQLA